MKLHWLPVKMRTIYKILLLTFKAQIGKSPVYLSELVHQYAPTRSLRSSQQSLLATSTRTSTKFYGQRSFSFAASNLWNNLPVHIRQANSVNHFKALLKTHLFECSYLWCCIFSIVLFVIVLWFVSFLSTFKFLYALRGSCIMRFINVILLLLLLL